MSAGSSTAATAVHAEGGSLGATVDDRRIPGEVGIWLFILADMTVFGSFFVLYMVYLRRDPTVFARGQSTLIQGFGIVNTLVLLLSSLLVAYGIRAIKRGQIQTGPKLFIGATICGLVFAFLKILEWNTKVADGITPATDNFYMLYFQLTGVHFFHVVVGLGVLYFLTRTARMTSVSPARMAAAESGACFWHLVDLLWIVIYPLLYLIH
ncbi:cytochrome c oxidase subunit 3 [Mycobacterium syngnathidarum]